jgi:hypothetical protein
VPPFCFAVVTVADDGWRRDGRAITENYPQRVRPRGMAARRLIVAMSGCHEKYPRRPDVHQGHVTEKEIEPTSHLISMIK